MVCPKSHYCQTADPDKSRPWESVRILTAKNDPGNKQDRYSHHLKKLSKSLHGVGISKRFFSFRTWAIQ